MVKWVDNCVKGAYNCLKVLLALSMIHGAIALFGTGMSVTNSMQTLKEPKISSKAKLEVILEKEKKKLGCHKNIKININEFISCAYANKLGKNQYEIVLDKEHFSEYCIKHELYHIQDGHCEDIEEMEKKNIFSDYLGGNHPKYFFSYEPQAIIYGLTGLKL